jgi:hypothetical protein
MYVDEMYMHIYIICVCVCYICVCVCVCVCVRANVCLCICFGTDMQNKIERAKLIYLSQTFDHNLKKNRPFEVSNNFESSSCLFSPPVVTL